MQEARKMTSAGFGGLGRGSCPYPALARRHRLSHLGHDEGLVEACVMIPALATMPMGRFRTISWE
jgi:hypothetical protein